MSQYKQTDTHLNSVCAPTVCLDQAQKWWYCEPILVNDNGVYWIAVLYHYTTDVKSENAEIYHQKIDGS